MKQQAHTNTITADDSAAIDSLLAEVEREEQESGKKVAGSNSVTGDEVIEPVTTPAGVDLDEGEQQDAAPVATKKAASKKTAGKKAQDKKPKGKPEVKADGEGEQSDAAAADVDAMISNGMQSVEAQDKKADKKPAEPPKRRVTYVGNRRSTVLADRAGDQLAKLMILEHADAELSDDDLKVKRDEFMRHLDTQVAKKVAEKCVMLMKDLAAGKVVKNEVMATAFRLLKTDGKLTSGDQGNLQQALIKKYSLGTARSQANQMFTLFPLLKITSKEKGLMVPNLKSTILELVNGPTESAE